jgi:WD40 repeat protein
MFSISSGEKIQNLISHSNEVSILKIDFANKLFITSGLDSTIMMQKEEKSSFELIRELNNMYNGKGINLIEISVFHNLLVTTTNSNVLMVWDYEYLKLLGSFELEKNVEPTSIIFINGYSVLTVGCNNMKIYFIYLSLNHPSFSMRVISVIDLLDYEKDAAYNDDQKSKFPNKLLFDLTYHQQTEELKECILYVGLIRGINLIFFFYKNFTFFI